MKRHSFRRNLLRDSRGQSILEFSIVMPILLLLVLGVVEFGFALLDQQVVTKLTREGSNLISRNSSLARREDGAADDGDAAGGFLERLGHDFLGAEERRDARHGQLPEDHPLPADVLRKR